MKDQCHTALLAALLSCGMLLAPGHPFPATPCANIRRMFRMLETTRGVAIHASVRSSTKTKPVSDSAHQVKQKMSHYSCSRRAQALHNMKTFAQLFSFFHPNEPGSGSYGLPSLYYTANGLYRFGKAEG
uniref:Uncharacterized protein n=1 Tax=Anopheles coluzzii TaxID=1518534 RepID=A0A8W7PWY8_ANOCL